MNHQACSSNRTAFGFVFAALVVTTFAITTCAVVACGAGRAMAADLGPYGGSPVYSALPPCLQFEHAYGDALRSIRQTARIFRSQEGRFHRLKRARMNDGFTGPDISLNATMSAEQIDVAFKATQVVTSVAGARRLRCVSAGRLNAIANEASRINHEIAEDQIWIDPRTYW